MNCVRNRSNTRSLSEHQPETMDGVRIVRPRLVILWKWNGDRQFVRLGVNVNRQVEPRECVIKRE